MIERTDASRPEWQIDHPVCRRGICHGQCIIGVSKVPHVRGAIGFGSKRRPSESAIWAFHNVWENALRSKPLMGILCCHHVFGELAPFSGHVHRPEIITTEVSPSILIGSTWLPYPSTEDQVIRFSYASFKVRAFAPFVICEFCQSPSFYIWRLH